jgi:putative ABC transport system permease protein
MDWLKRDLRGAFRLLGRDKAFTATAALTLSLCLGANVALFSVVHHVLLRPLPIPDPERVVFMANQYPRAGAEDSTDSGVTDYYDRLAALNVFEEQALLNHSSVSIGRDGLPLRIRAANVTPSFFRLCRVAPSLGRAFTEDEGEVGNEKKLVLSDALWRSQFGADPAAVGKDLMLDGQPYAIVGVMPKRFQAMDPGTALFRPLAFTAEDKSDDNRHSNNYWNLGRLKPGATPEQAQAQVDALNAANLERFPQFKEVLINAGFHTSVGRLQDRIVKDVRATLYLMWGGALFVLLIGCVNVANLVLVRARVRAKELATRLALGAERWQVARQLVIENAVLTLAAAGLGLGLAAMAMRALGALDLQDLPYGSEIALDGLAIAYGVGVSLAIGLVMGLLPLVSLMPRNLSAVLREEGRANSGGLAARTLRRALVVAQVAFTFVLLVGAGLLFASFRKVLAINPGFVAEGVLTASVSLPQSRYAEDPALRQFTDEALRRVRALPGVITAGATDSIPFGGHHNDSVILAEGHVMQPGESLISPAAVDVTPGYFESMGTRLKRGRLFTDADTAGGPSVLIVDENLARRFWPGQDPIGRRMYRPGSPEDVFAINEKTVFLTVVGVIGDVKIADMTEGDKAVGVYYYPMAQDVSRLVTFAIKSNGKPEALTPALREAIVAIDPELPLFDVRTMEQRSDRALLNRRSPALLSLSFGVVALVLSAVGLYGVLAYLVAQRQREIGIRIALGSSSRAIFELVLREGVGLVAAGFACGVLAALLLRRGLESQLFGVEATDPLVVGGVSLLLASVALLACALPARRATRIDPSIVLSE